MNRNICIAALIAFFVVLFSLISFVVCNENEKREKQDNVPEIVTSYIYTFAVIDINDKKDTIEFKCEDADNFFYLDHGDIHWYQHYTSVISYIKRYSIIKIDTLNEK